MSSPCTLGRAGWRRIDRRVDPMIEHQGGPPSKPLTLADWQANASQYLTGGMSSSFRANQFTGVPFYATHARGPRIWDVTGKEYIDFFLCHGAVLLGHDEPAVRTAVQRSAEKGFYAGVDTVETIDLARKICELVPAAETIRFVNSGTEGTLLALRLARGVTGRDKVLRVDGHFHGIQDYLMANNLASKVDADNPGDRPSRPRGRTAGVPRVVEELTITVPWHNAELLETVLEQESGQVAAIIMNPIDYNNGVFVASPEYLHRVQALARKHGAVLIFDEVLCGFKTGPSCAQGYFGVTPDLCILGKALTNDVPLAVVAGSRTIMDKIMDPHDPVIAGGTYSGNQLGVAAGNAVLEIIGEPGFYEPFLTRAERFFSSLQELFDRFAFPAVVQSLGAGFHIYVGTREPVTDYHGLARRDWELTRRVFSSCIDHGLYFHTDFTVSFAHDQHTLDEALERFEAVLSEFEVTRD